MQAKSKSKALALLLVLIMVFAMVPAHVLGYDGDNVDGEEPFYSMETMTATDFLTETDDFLWQEMSIDPFAAGFQPMRSTIAGFEGILAVRNGRLVYAPRLTFSSDGFAFGPPVEISGFHDIIEVRDNIVSNDNLLVEPYQVLRANGDLYEIGFVTSNDGRLLSYSSERVARNVSSFTFAHGWLQNSTVIDRDNNLRINGDIVMRQVTDVVFAEWTLADRRIDYVALTQNGDVVTVEPTPRVLLSNISQMAASHIANGFNDTGHMRITPAVFALDAQNRVLVFAPETMSSPRVITHSATSISHGTMGLVVRKTDRTLWSYTNTSENPEFVGRQLPVGTDIAHFIPAASEGRGLGFTNFGVLLRPNGDVFAFDPRTDQLVPVMGGVDMPAPRPRPTLPSTMPPQYYDLYRMLATIGHDFSTVFGGYTNFTIHYLDTIGVRHVFTLGLTREIQRAVVTGLLDIRCGNYDVVANAIMNNPDRVQAVVRDLVNDIVNSRDDTVMHQYTAMGISLFSDFLKGLEGLELDRQANVLEAFTVSREIAQLLSRKAQDYNQNIAMLESIRGLSNSRLFQDTVDGVIREYRQSTTEAMLQFALHWSANRFVNEAIRLLSGGSLAVSVVSIVNTIARNVPSVSGLETIIVTDNLNLSLIGHDGAFRVAARTIASGTFTEADVESYRNAFYLARGVQIMRYEAKRARFRSGSAERNHIDAQLGRLWRMRHDSFVASEPFRPQQSGGAAGGIGGVLSQSVVINCPVDVAVFDSRQNLVAQIIDSVPTNFAEDTAYAFVMDDVKYVFLSDDDTFTIGLSATDYGTMSFAVVDISFLLTEDLAQKEFVNVDLYPGREMLSHIVANTPDVELLLVQNGVVVGDIATDGTTTMRPQTPTPPQTPPAAPPQQPDPTPTPPQGSPLDSSPASLLPVVPREPQPAAAPAGEPTNDAPYYMDYDDEAPTEAPQTVAMPIPAPPQSANRLTFTANHTQYSLNGTVKTSVGAPFIDPAVGRMMIPLRTVAEALGVAAEWDSSAQAAVISLPTGVLTLPVDQQLPDGMGAPLMVNDHLFIPLRFVMYAFDATVAWDGANRAAVITW